MLQEEYNNMLEGGNEYFQIWANQRFLEKMTLDLTFTGLVKFHQKPDYRVVKKAAREDFCSNHFGSEGIETGWNLRKIAEIAERVCIWLVSEESGKREGRPCRHIYGLKGRVEWRRLGRITVQMESWGL